MQNKNPSPAIANNLKIIELLTTCFHAKMNSESFIQVNCYEQKQITKNNRNKIKNNCDG
jgi:hypothetical protein